MESNKPASGKVHFKEFSGIKNPDSEFLDPTTTWDDPKLGLSPQIL